VPSPSPFFADRSAGRPGLVLFLVAGDPPLDVFREIVLLMDDQQVDCLELAVPFPDSPTDGPVIQDSARRALDRGVDLEAVLGFVEGIRPELSHMKIALLADWSYSIKGTPLRDFLERVQATGTDGLLIHGLPPRLRPEYYEAADATGLPIVTTCYATSDEAVLHDAAEHASAYIYLVSAYGRSGTVGPPDHSALVPVLETLRQRSKVPIAVGFGIKDRSHVEGVGAVGADAAIIGSTCVARVADTQAAGGDVVEDFRGLLGELVPSSQPTKGVSQ
jgi:tryptophan synthase alpha chain